MRIALLDGDEVGKAEEKLKLMVYVEDCLL